MRKDSTLGVTACVLMGILAVSPVTLRAGVLYAAFHNNDAVSAVQLALRVYPDGHADAHGTVLVWPEGNHDSPTVLVARDATAACADTDGDGSCGLIQAVIGFLDAGSGDRVIGILTASDGGEITDGGEATLQLEGQRISRVIDIVVGRRGRPVSTSR